MTSATVTIKGADRLGAKLTSLVDIADFVEDECADRIVEVMRATAVRKLTTQGAVDTGLLRASVETDDGYNSFTERNSDTSVSVGIRNDISYGIFIEYGTGPRGDPEVPHTDKMRWVYPTGDPSRPFRVAVSQPARPFMRPALYDNRRVFAEIIRKRLKEVYL